MKLTKKVILTKAAPAPIGPYSQAIDLGSIVFFCGQIPIEPATGELIAGGIKEQTTQVLKNIEACLRAGDLQFSNVVKTTIYLTDLKDFATVNEIYGQYFTTEPPARTTIQVAALPKGSRVEIEITAARF